MSNLSNSLWGVLSEQQTKKYWLDNTFVIRQSCICNVPVYVIWYKSQCYLQYLCVRELTQSIIVNLTKWTKWLHASLRTTTNTTLVRNVMIWLGPHVMYMLFCMTYGKYLNTHQHDGGIMVLQLRRFFGLTFINAVTSLVTFLIVRTIITPCIVNWILCRSLTWPYPRAPTAWY